MKKQLTVVASVLAIGGIIAGLLAPVHKASATVPGVNQLISQSTAGVLEDNPTMTDLHYPTGWQSFNGQQISGNGRYIVFTSRATNLVSGDTNNQPDAFIRDTVAGTTTRYSLTNAGTPYTYDSYAEVISNNGRYALFVTYGSTSKALYVRDLVANTSTLVEGSSFADVTGNGISNDGRYVIFSTDSTTLSSTNYKQVYIKDMTTGTLKRLTTDSTGSPANNESRDLGLSCSGNVALFVTQSTNMPGYSGSTNDWKLYAVRIGWNSTDYTLIDDNLFSIVGGQLSCDGTKVVYEKNDGLFGHTNVHEYDLSNGQNTIVNLNTTGAQVWANAGVSLSGDGRYVVFTTNDENVVSGYTSTDSSHAHGDIYIRDLKKSTTDIITFVGSHRAGGASKPVISSDGSTVAYKYITPALGDTAHELVPGLNTGTATPANANVYYSQTGL